MKFSDIPGQESTKEALRKAADTRRIPHAIMLSGPSGVGKTLLARTFMQYVHCPDPVDGEPCGKCRNCRLHKELTHPDVHFSYPIVKNKAKDILVSEDMKDAWIRMLSEAPAMPVEAWLEIIEAGNSQPAIHVEEAEEIIRIAAYPPYSSDTKFFLIRLPERMNIESANKLLKVIEEPAPGICFILISNNEQEVLPTIFSRTGRIHVGTIDNNTIESYLIHRWNVSEYDAYRIAPLAGGRLSKADEFGGHSGETDEFRSLSQDLMRAAYGRKIVSLKNLSEKVAGLGREKICRFLRYIDSMVRENLIYNLKMPPLSRLTPEEEAFSKNFSPFINAANVEDIMAETDRARMEIERNCSPKIVLFDYFLLLIPLIRKKL